MFGWLQFARDLQWNDSMDDAIEEQNRVPLFVVNSRGRRSEYDAADFQIRLEPQRSLRRQPIDGNAGIHFRWTTRNRRQALAKRIRDGPGEDYECSIGGILCRLRYGTDERIANFAFHLGPEIVFASKIVTLRRRNLFEDGAQLLCEHRCRPLRNGYS